MNIKEMRARLEDAGFDPRYADATEALAQPCLRFDTIPTDESELALGCSKLGGFPDLPVGVPWPFHGDRPLVFLGQFNAHDFSQFSFCKDLPPEGILYFFLDMDLWAEGYDPSDRGNWRVIYHLGPPEELERCVPPEHGPTTAVFIPCRIVLHEALSPGWDKIPCHALVLDVIREDEYQGFIDRLPDEKNHQVLGRPGRIEDLQYLMQLECQFLSHCVSLDQDRKPVDEARAREVAPGALDWRLLLQLDSDKGTGMDWGDSMLSFWIRERDLQDRNFSEVWMIEEWF